MVQKETVCPTCGDEFSSESAMKIHHTKSHGDSITGHEIECDECSTKFNKVPSMIERDENHYCSKSCRLEGQSRSEDELIEFLQTLQKEMGRPPRRDDLRGNTGCDYKTIKSYFGSWNAALEAAGIGINEKWKHTEEECISDLQRTADDIGKTPTVEEHRSHGEINPNIIIRKFGKWINAVSEAGLDTDGVVERNVSEERLIDEIKRVRGLLDRTPMLDDMDQLSEFSSATYQSRLGWTETLKELGYELNYGKESEHSPRTYSSIWPEQKKKARKRDGYQCSRCGESNQNHIERTGKQLHVHHITWDENASAKERDRLENLMTLCSSCHPKIERLPVRPQFVVENKVVQVDDS